MNIKKLYNRACYRGYGFCLRHSNLLLMVLGVGLLLLGSQISALAQGNPNHPRYGMACDRLLRLIEGPFGALVTAAAGVAAIVAAALGGFKMAWALIVVAVGAFILRAYITLFFTGC